LDKKVEEEVKRTQENNQYDIDRINTFLAIGIGLLTIIGGLLPLAVNFISKHDIESRVKDIEDRVKESKETVEEAKTKMPTVDLLILQSAIAKLTSKETLSLFLGDKQYSDISNMIQRVISAFKLFESENFQNYSEEQIIYINELLKELKLSLKYGSIRRSPSTSRAIHEKIDELVIICRFLIMLTHRSCLCLPAILAC